MHLRCQYVVTSGRHAVSVQVLSEHASAGDYLVHIGHALYIALRNTHKHVTAITAGSCGTQFRMSGSLTLVTCDTEDEALQKVGQPPAGSISE